MRRRRSGGAAAKKRLAHLLRQSADHVVLLVAGQGFERRQPLLRRAGAQRADLVRRQQCRARACEWARRRSRAPSALLRFGALHQLLDHQAAIGVGGEGNLPGGHLAHDLRRRIIAHQLLAGHGRGCRTASAFRARTGFSAMRSGCSCRSIHFFRPMAFTCAASPGRGPKVSRLSACRIRSSLEICREKLGDSPLGIAGVNRHPRERSQKQNNSQSPKCSSAHRLPSELLNSGPGGELRRRLEDVAHQMT